MHTLSSVDHHALMPQVVPHSFPAPGASAPGSDTASPNSSTHADASWLPPILVADDDADDRFLIQRLIAKTGAANPILPFDDGSEVVNYLGGLAAAGSISRHHAPSLLFLDLKMTGLGGFGFLEWARSQKNALPLTIVVLSNSVEPGDVTRALMLGARRYLVKYPSVQTFTTIIRSVYPFTLSR
jgi:CheY-like chemotaxis protein